MTSAKKQQPCFLFVCVCVSLCIGWLSDLLIHEDLKKICNMLPPSQPLIHNRQLNQHKSLLNPNSVTTQHVSAPLKHFRPATC